MSLKYEVRFRYGEPQLFEDSNAAACAITGNDEYIDGLEVDVDEAIDDSYGRIEICGETYWASRILRELDEYQYDQYCAEERRNCAENNVDYVEEMLDRMDDGDEESFEGGITVTCFEDDEDEDTEESDDGFMEILDYAT